MHGIFGNEPVVRVTAPLPQEQFIETRLINLLHYKTLIASEAARCVLAAAGKPVVDVDLRRSHGAEAGFLTARASYLAGLAGSATVLAELSFDVPIRGTMGRGFVQAHEAERYAFDHFADAQPDNLILLLDTYDTREGAQKVLALAPRLQEKGITIEEVRLDSGDLVDQARMARRILDDGGLEDASIKIREYAAAELAALPDETRRCRQEATIPVRISSALQNPASVVDARRQVGQG